MRYRIINKEHTSVTIDTLEQTSTATMSGCPFHSVGADFNPFSEAHNQNPYAFYARAQAEEPVFFSPMLQCWVVTRYDDIGMILRDMQHFTSVGVVAPVAEFTPEVKEILSAGIPPLVNSLISLDAPMHTRIRSSVNKSFSARRVAGFEPRIRQIADQLIDRFAADGQADLVSQFNYVFPASVIFDLIGVPEHELDRVKRWSDQFSELLFVPLSPEQQAECARGVVAFQQYVLDLIEQRRAAPQDDLISDLIGAIDRGEADISINELVELLLNIIFAGHETTTNLLGNCLGQVLTDRPLWQAIGQEPQLIRPVVEEAVRFNGPALGFFRIVAKPVEIGGVMLEPGARVFLLYSAANRDAAHFPKPDQFEPQRDNVGRHMGFGAGIHFCLGAPLARLEMRVALERLNARLPGLRLQSGQDLHYKINLAIHGLERLLVEWDV
jgi:cytochrome P450